jgi:hypothetical protein
LVTQEHRSSKSSGSEGHRVATIDAPRGLERRQLPAATTMKSKLEASDLRCDHLLREGEARAGKELFRDSEASPPAGGLWIMAEASGVVTDVTETPC